MLQFSVAEADLGLLTRNDSLLRLLRDDFRKRLDDIELLRVTSYQEGYGYKGFGLGLDGKVCCPSDLFGSLVLLLVITDC